MNKNKNRRIKEDCFPTLVINTDKYLNEALTLFIQGEQLEGVRAKKDL